MADITFDSLLSEVQGKYRAFEFELADGTVVSLSSVALLPRTQRKAVIDAVKVVNAKSTDVDKQETAIDAVLLAAADNADALASALDSLPLGAKGKLIQLWAEVTQTPEA